MSGTDRVSLLRVGSLLIQPVSDGVLSLDPSDIFAEADPDQWRSRVQLDARGRVELALTCLLVQSGDRRILVDTGFGERADWPEVGHLLKNLAAIGVTSDDIQAVVISHPHGDHIGGATTGTGNATRSTFAGAHYWLGQADWEHFTQPDVLAQTGLADKLLPLAKAEKLDLADGEREIAPGVRLVPLPGHTPGHIGVAFASGQEMAVYVGDMIHHALQVEHPDWSTTFDVLPALSRETRRNLVERARRERSVLLSYHLPFPGIGRVGTGWTPSAA